MTLVEFLAPLKKGTRQNQILAVLYFCHRYKNHESLTVESIRRELRSARVSGHAKINVADVLSKSGHFVDSPGSEGAKRLWRLTDSGTKHVRELLDLPAADPDIEHDVGALTSLVGSLNDAEVKAYVEESIKCLQVGALRAAIVFLWSGAIRTLQDKALSLGSTPLTAAVQKHDRKARKIARIEDYSYIKDKTALLAFRDLGLIDKSEKDTLEEALSLRNRCGHPGKYKPGAKKASSFVEDIISIVF